VSPPSGGPTARGDGALAGSFVFDGHNDLALRILDGEDPSGSLPGGHLDLPRMRRAGLDGGVFAVWIAPTGPDPLERTLRGLRALRRWLEAGEGVRPVLDASDLGTARRAGEVAAVMGVEGGYGIVDDLGAVDRLHEAGMRCLTLTWTLPTAWADAAGAPARHGGITPFGARVVQRLQERGVAVDLSHASDATVRDVLARTERPVIASHSSVRAIADHPRNLPDALLRGIAGSGGVVGVNFFPGFLDEEYARVWERVRRELGSRAFGPGGRRALARERPPPVGVERLAEHVEHALRVAGPEAVGLGSDFDGIPALPDGISDVTDLPRLARVLEERGLDRETLEAVLGGNFRRLFLRLLG